MICTQRDSYFKKLISNDLMISWMATLVDGTTVYGDYDRPGMENPWIRLKNYCEESNATIKKIELHMFGAEK